jgi:glutamate-ammonia-ligase adenylyltransferase
MAVVAMGKLGSGEMSAESDLDLIVIYDVDDGEAVSNGPRELGVTQYYAKACQQLVNALTAPTAEGKLYEVDMRLRPSGNAGPIATRYDSFAAYQEGEAWTWEHMALTRARVAAGPAPLAQKIETEISRVLRKPRDPVKLAADVADMRARIAKEFPASDPWELKHVRGGLIDLEFIAQYLQLRYAAEMPEILSPHTRGVFEAAGRLGILPPAEADLLLHAIDLVLNLTQVVRICVTGTLNREETNIGLKNLLARVGDAPDFEALEADLRESQKAVLSLFESLIGGAFQDR